MDLNDTMGNFVDFFDSNVDTELDIWDPIFLTQETAEDHEQRNSVYAPVVEAISDNEIVPTTQSVVPDETLCLHSLHENCHIEVEGGCYQYGVWCPRDLKHAADIDALLTSNTVKFFFFDKSGATHKYTSEEDMDRALV